MLCLTYLSFTMLALNAFPIYKLNKRKRKTTHYKICLYTRSWSETCWQKETTKGKENFQLSCI